MIRVVPIVDFVCVHYYHVGSDIQPEHSEVNKSKVYTVELVNLRISSGDTSKQKQNLVLIHSGDNFKWASRSWDLSAMGAFK